MSAQALPEAAERATDARMTPDEYRATLTRLGLTQSAAAPFIGVDARTSRRYANAKTAIPGSVVLALAQAVHLKDQGMTLEEIFALRRGVTSEPPAPPKPAPRFQA